MFWHYGWERITGIHGGACGMFVAHDTRREIDSGKVGTKTLSTIG